MRILIVHNYYGSDAPSGENIAVDAEIKLLRMNGHEVEVFSKRSDSLRAKGIAGKLKAGLLFIYNLKAKKELSSILNNFKADVVHVHNTFPILSNSIFEILLKEDIPVLITLHNYRYSCANGLHIRNKTVCTTCIGKSVPIAALKHRCYKASFLQTIPWFFSKCLSIFKAGTNIINIDGIIVLSDFQKSLLIKNGFNERNIYIKPNFTFSSNSNEIFPQVTTNNEFEVTFVGRLSEEKGLRTLLKAWKHWGGSAPMLNIVGDGELKSKITEESTARKLNVKFHGHLDRSGVERILDRTSLLVVPSECYETFGLVIIEAFSRGIPVLGSDMGAIPSVIDRDVDGLIFRQKDYIDLFTKAKALFDSKALLEKLSANAYISYKNKFSEKAAYSNLMKIYNAVLIERKNNDRKLSP
ncbi:glycosyltransferase family 4 protein [Aliidiomarina celeris]|uniref:glycosyltransferase family 4 protein n=1 Tax=Aliidiomarina celeris TaxID=2249428 RepID=UPI0018E605A6|nr:glycosyltransferase family 4 protein [Aliidiomarina celeris]